MEFNKYQSSIEELNIDKYPEEVQEQFYDFLNNVPFIRNLTSPKRLRAKDLPRDEEGKIIVDITNPHILEDMDYFRPSAIHYQKYGCYTKLRPNPNPNSEYGKWIREEVRRCHEGYIRESDGEWITGDYYYFLNYAPMQLIKKEDKSKKAGQRVFDFPNVWEGHYIKFHAILQARNNGHHYAELASRSKGKSFSAASMLAKRFILGESKEVNKKVTCYVTAGEKKYLVAGDQTLDKFQYDIDWMATTMELPSLRLINSLSNMQWIMGYKDTDTGTNKGTLNSVIGVTSKDDPAKLRGSRGVLYVIEEMGAFPSLFNLYNNIRPSVEDGDDVFGLIMAYGTAGDDQSDFQSAQELVYNPKGYNIQPFKNVYDKEGQGKAEFAFFFPGYMNLSGCYNSDGVSDVTKALLFILQDRYTVKYNSTDINAIAKRTAEIPITPQEAMLRTRGNMFPINQLNDRLNQLDSDLHCYDNVYVGDVMVNNRGEAEFKLTSDTVIREYPTKDNKVNGAVEIYQMPQKDNNGKVFNNRYIVGHDPVDDDSAETMSLTSTFVLDLWTDQIVAEYTGRQDYAEDNFEKVRALCYFYNAKCLYEKNKKGLFAYFSKMSCTHLLADTPEYLKDMEMIKVSGYGNNAKGVHATQGINNYANERIRDWLLKPVNTIIKDENGVDQEVTINNLYHIKNRALLRELALFNPVGNFDRIRALGMLMLYREEKIIMYQGDMNNAKKTAASSANYLGNDPFFKKNWDNRFNK